MNCEECKSHVFELIEREAVDPEGVHAILADCPDCRAEFDATKAALVIAEQLPVEEPPGDIDAAILRKAALHIQNAAATPAAGVVEEATVVPLRKRWLQTPPWAMAAVALLAVGVGVWSIPRDVQRESAAEQSIFEADQAGPMAEAPAEEVLGGGQAHEEAEVAELDEIREPAPVASSTPAKSAGRPARRELPRAKKRVDSVAKQSAPATAPAAAAEAEADDLAMARAAAPSATKGEGEDCKARVAAFERRLSDDKGYEPEPEEELAIGRCYQSLGDTGKARTWLQRAAADPATKRRARKALRSLPAN